MRIRRRQRRDPAAEARGDGAAEQIGADTAKPRGCESTDRSPAAPSTPPPAQLKPKTASARGKARPQQPAPDVAEEHRQGEPATTHDLKR